MHEDPGESKQFDKRPNQIAGEDGRTYLPQIEDENSQIFLFLVSKTDSRASPDKLRKNSVCLLLSESGRGT